MKKKAEYRPAGCSEDGEDIVEITLHERLPYTNRSSPLVFKCVFSHRGDAVSCDFGDFKVDYQGAPFNPAFRKDVPWKGIARDSNGALLGEAVGLSIDSGKGVTFRETHRDKEGKVCFSATSSMDVNGIKRQETDATGRKQNEYFFLWPQAPLGHGW
jgi:hypothetical protein